MEVINITIILKKVEEEKRNKNQSKNNQCFLAYNISVIKKYISKIQFFQKFYSDYN